MQTTTGNIALELKYPTRKLACIVVGEEFALKDQAAQDTRRYDFIKDSRAVGACGGGLFEQATS